MQRAFTKALCRVGLLSLVLGGGALAMPSLASANPTCGQVVHTTITLSKNMSCGSTTGLYVGNNRITINLNGHTISGAGSFNNHGIDNSGDWPASAPGSGGVSGPDCAFNNVVVKNGNVTQFSTGIDGESAADGDCPGPRDMTIATMTVYHNVGDGLALTDALNSAVTGSHFNNNGSDGAFLGGNTNLNISSSTFNWNSGDGIFDVSSQATLNGVSMNANGRDGFLLDIPVAPYLIKNSTANGNGTGGNVGASNNSGFFVYNNNNQFNAIKFTGNNAENNGLVRKAGWGYYTQSVANGSNNGYENNFSGGCHNVRGCHLNP